MVGTEKSTKIEKVELDIDGLEPMTLRYLVALYKRGVDEVKVTFKNPEFISSIQKAIGKEAVGYEITEQGKEYCIIKHVSGELEDFNPVLRRTFLLLISMAEESLNAINKKDYSNLKNIAFLEEANNRFTTTCRRFLNKKGYSDMRKVGPLYYIIEELENIADQYKYLCNYLFNASTKNKKFAFTKEIEEIYAETNKMLKEFYEMYYKFDKEKLVNIGKQRKELVTKILDLFEKNSTNKILLYHLFTIIQKIFCLIGPYLVINYVEQ